MFTLPQASTFASKSDQIFLFVFLISLAFLVAITGVMIYFVIRYSRKRHPTATQIEGHTGLEITWTVIPLVLFVAIFYFGWTNYDYSRRAPRDAMVVKVMGRQWSWTFQYPNGKQTTRLYAALRRPMKVEVVSADVVHGFYVPAFRLKMDAVPGRTNMTWFEPTLLGSFDIQCTVICGVDHSAMLSTVEVVNEDAFKAWYFGPEGTPEPRPERNSPQEPALAAAPSGSASVALAARASAAPPEAVVVLKRNACLGCHSLDGTPMTGPTFKGLFGRRSPLVRNGVVEHVEMNEEQIAIAINEPSRDVVQGYPPMTKVQVTPDEIGTIVQYLKTLQ
jgi:cytochrome c oxidase subunit II